MALELNGEHTVDLSREKVWLLLNDPDVLSRTIPGCDSLQRSAEDRYELGLKLLVGSVSGNYKGAVVLSEKNPPANYFLTLVGEGSIGFVKGSARFDLDEIALGRTTITYRGAAEVGGLVAGVGNRVLSGVAKFMVKRFFAALDKEVKEAAATASTTAGRESHQ
ncbi:MAG TPA: carbon monoxide dehydrogenase subunit G [Burkholderiales bacterium]|jgi:carbon monoxide dehydrogenase subunit G|nr:carbon monoxide dehydrogenase subunit G [Burkholderiales bacterium]